jgi:hypothetical protein
MALAAVVASAILATTAMAAPTLISQKCDPALSANGFCGAAHISSHPAGTPAQTDSEARRYCDSVGVTSSCNLWDNQACAGEGASFKAGQSLYCKA